jgi:hypothetical protein
MTGKKADNASFACGVMGVEIDQRLFRFVIIIIW